MLAVPYFTIFIIIRPKPDLIIFNGINPQPYLISAFSVEQKPSLISSFSIEEKPSHTLFCLFNNIRPKPYHKTLAVAYFSIFNNIGNQLYLIFAFATLDLLNRGFQICSPFWICKYLFFIDLVLTV